MQSRKSNFAFGCAMKNNKNQFRLCARQVFCEEKVVATVKRSERRSVLVSWITHQIRVLVIGELKENQLKGTAYLRAACGRFFRLYALRVVGQEIQLVGGGISCEAVA